MGKKFNYMMRYNLIINYKKAIVFFPFTITFNTRRIKS